MATYTIVAWRLLGITYLARYHPETPADTVLATHEWQALYCTIHKTPQPSISLPNLNTCVRWIAQLGGFLGRCVRWRTWGENNLARSAATA